MNTYCSKCVLGDIKIFQGSADKVLLLHENNV